MFGFKTFAEKTIECKGRSYDRDLRQYTRDRAAIERLIARFEREIEIAEANKDRLLSKLTQIATVCRDNSTETSNHRMTLDFIRQIAES
jgi:uncharacterized protein YlxP (DUF503 family)